MIIYAAVNKINGKIYVGKTTKTLKKRKYEHIQKAKKYKKTYFHRAIVKYGEENFSWEILNNSCKNEEALKYTEIYYIGYFTGRKGKVYNLTIGGEGTKGLNAWDRMSEDQKKKCRLEASKRNSGKNNYFYGKTGEKHVCSKKYKLTSPTGEVYNIHGLRKFCRDNPEFNLKHNYLSYVANGKQTHHKGWKCELLL